MIYRFKDLTEIADHLETKATNIYERLRTANVRSKRYTEEKARAAEMESIAYMLRSTTLGPKESGQ